MIAHIEPLIHEDINDYLQKYQNSSNITILHVTGSNSIKKLIDIDLSLFPNIKELRLSKHYQYDSFMDIKNSILHFKHILALVITDFVVFRGMFLKDFPNLIYFELAEQNNPNINLGFVKNLKNLRCLNISYYKDNIKYLPQIRKLKHLESLFLKLHTSLENISDISDIPSLKKLDIEQHVYVNGEQITNLLPLIQLINSKNLNDCNCIIRLPFRRFKYDDRKFCKYTDDMSFKSIREYLCILHREKILKEMHELI